MSPKEFHALCKRLGDREERWDGRIADCMAFYVNSHSPKGAKTIDRYDIMRKKRPVDSRVMSAQEQVSTLTRIFGIGPGYTPPKPFKRSSKR